MTERPGECSESVQLRFTRNIQLQPYKARTEISYAKGFKEQTALRPKNPGIANLLQIQHGGTSLSIGFKIAKMAKMGAKSPAFAQGRRADGILSWIVNEV